MSCWISCVELVHLICKRNDSQACCSKGFFPLISILLLVCLYELIS
jgi:hypothetical protein